MSLFKKIFAASGLLTPYGDEKSLKDLDGLVDINKLKSSDWIDLGLPSGLLWATRNVAASSPTDDGDCYFWGSITPNVDLEDIDSYAYYKYDEQKDGSWLEHLLEYGSLDPVSTQMPSSIEDRDKTGLAKYCSSDDYGYNGFTDNLTILESMDDAATANYGGRMPTKEEWQELCDNTTSRWIAMDGLVGRCFTGPNGNTLFLPASYDAGNDSLQAELNGCYLSSSLYVDNPYSAWTLQFDSKEVGVCEGCRYFFKWSVRAVRSAH